MKTKFWKLTCLVIAASMILLGACAPSQTAAPTAAPTTPPVAPTSPSVAPTTPPVAPTTPPVVGEPVKITIFVGFGTGTDDSQIAVHQQIAKEFNDTHKDIQIEFVTVTWEEHATKFSTMLAGNMAPDLAIPIGVQGVAEFYDEWLDISPYIKRDNYDVSDFYGPSLQLQTYPDKTIGIPIGVYPSVMFYNEDLFDKAGLSYPPDKFGDPTWTYDKVIELAQKLTLDKNGKTPTDAGFDPTNIVQYGWDGWDQSPFRIVPAKFGGSPLGMTADYKTAEMNKDGYLQAMQFVRDSIWKYYVRPNGEYVDSTLSSGDSMGPGTVAMWEVFSWMAYAWPDWEGVFNWNVAAIPAGPTGKVVAETNGDAFAITKSSKHPDQAWEVAKYLLQPDIMKRLCESYGCIPSRKSLASGWLDSMKEQYPKVNFQLFIDAIDYMDASPNNESWVPEYQRIWDATENAYSEVVSGANKDVQAVMDALNTEVQGYLDEYWANKK